MAKVLIVYTSRAGETEKMANLIAEGVRFTGNEAVVKVAVELSARGTLQTNTLAAMTLDDFVATLK